MRAQKGAMYLSSPTALRPAAILKCSSVSVSTISVLYRSVHGLMKPSSAPSSPATECSLNPTALLNHRTALRLKLLLLRATVIFRREDHARSSASPTLPFPPGTTPVIASSPKESRECSDAVSDWTLPGPRLSLPRELITPRVLLARAKAASLMRRTSRESTRPVSRRASRDVRRLRALSIGFFPLPAASSSKPHGRPGPVPEILSDCTRRRTFWRSSPVRSDSRKYVRCMPFPLMLISPRSSSTKKSPHPLDRSASSVALDMCTLPAAPCEYMRLAVFTVSPNTRKLSCLCPMTPAMSDPVCTPTFTWKTSPMLCSTSAAHFRMPRANLAARFAWSSHFSGTPAPAR
mmetsp:Transcript_9088/g.31637  ORF Transcript_9088/g.31637 Transcript_9088/m.31637 type:complete len:348 (+) Transcript_9088:1279-2322(+)